MSKRVLALGLDPKFSDLTKMKGLTPDVIRSFIDEQIERVRSFGYEVKSCLVDTGATAELVLARLLEAEQFDCVVIGAGLRDSDRLLLFERLLNVVHEKAGSARVCFNTTPADTAEAVRRWV